MSIADKLTQVAENVPRVYAKGHSDGIKTEYDTFWDAHPTAKGYCSGINLFGGAGWNDTTFKPKHDLILGNCYMVFKNCAVTDLVKILKECGVTLDFSRCNTFYYAFAESKITHIEEIPLTHSEFSSLTSSTGNMFSHAYFLHTIDKIIVKSDGTTLFSNDMFTRADSLANITFEGVIGRNINFQWCPLTKESITNIIEHLSDSATGQTVTFKNSAKKAAFTDDEWSALIATKPNWIVSLV